jgi:hypothetical protein
MFALKNQKFPINSLIILKDRRDFVRSLVIEFLKIPIGKLMNQRIAYIDRMVSLQEKKIIQFFVIYVQKLIEFTENPFDNVNTENYEKVYSN